METCRGIKLLMSKTKPKSREKSPRRYILRMMPGKEPLDAKRFERKINHSACRLLSETLAPVIGSQMNSHLKNLLVTPVRPQSGASDKLMRLKREDRPVLNLVGAHHFDLATESFADLIRSKRATDQRRYPGITPKRHGQSQISFVPLAEPKTIRRQKISPRPTHSTLSDGLPSSKNTTKRMTSPLHRPSGNDNRCGSPIQ